MRRICFVGNSHVASVRKAVDALKDSDTFDDVEVTVFGSHRDSLKTAKVNGGIISSDDEFVQNNAQICKEWKWKSEHRIYVKMLGKPPSAEWARKAYEENLQILARFEHNFDNNLPISHRLKDYPELHKPVTKTRTMNLYKIVIPIFEHLNIEREWTEILDSKKAILEEDWAS